MNKTTFPIPPNCKSITQELDLENNRIITTFDPEFKRGRIVITNRNSIAILSGNTNMENCPTIDVILFPDGLYNQRLHFFNYPFSVVVKRDANKDEENELFISLAEAGKQWNAEKRCIEDLKVIPKVGDCVRIYEETSSRYCIVGIVDEHDEIGEKGQYLYSDGSGAKVEKKTMKVFNKNAFITEILSKGQFQSKLNDLGFEYNFNDDTISELRWKPKDGEECYAISLKEGAFVCRRILFVSGEESFHDNAFKEGRIKRTIEECEEAIIKIKNILK